MRVELISGDHRSSADLKIRDAMKDDNTPGRSSASSSAPTSFLPPVVPPKEAAAVAAAAAAEVMPRERFTVKLTPSETVIVSWKKLLKKSGKSAGTADGQNFEADELATKHNGDIVNKEKPEEIEHNQAPKKRRRTVSANIPTIMDCEKSSSEIVDLDNVPKEAVARISSSMGKSTPCKTVINYAEDYQGSKLVNRRLNASTYTYKKKSADFANHPEKASSVNLSNKNSLLLPLESKYLDKHKTGAISSRDLVSKTRGTTESFNGMHLASRDKGISSPINSQPKSSSSAKIVNELSAKVRHKETNGASKFPDLNSSRNVNPMQRTASHEGGIKRKRLASSISVEETTLGAQIRPGHERPVNISSRQVLVSTGKVIPNGHERPVNIPSRQVLVSTGKVIPNRQRQASSGLPAGQTPTSDSGPRHSLKIYDKVRGSTALKHDDRTVVNAERNVKRDTDSNAKFIDTQLKLPKLQMKQRLSSN